MFAGGAALSDIESGRGKDGDTFYLDAPVNDVNTAVPVGGTTISLASVPTGIAVEALGRCVATSSSAGTDVLLYTPTAAPGVPMNYPTAPGYSIKTTVVTSQATTALAYRIYTNTSAQIAARAASSATLQCMTDGCVWQRGK